MTVIIMAGWILTISGSINMKLKYFYYLILYLFLLTACGTQETTVSEIPEAPETELLTETESESESEIFTESESESLTESESETENLLAPYLGYAGITPDQLQDCQQLIVVQSSGTDADVFLFEHTESGWSESLCTSGVVGKYGVSQKSREGEPYTPKGLFALGIAFGTEFLDDLRISYRQITQNSYWVDDPESEFYNQWVESNDIRWNSAEHLIDYPSAYHYGISIEYNRNPVIPYAGSAIFLHCRTGAYTAGCVAIPEADMLNILYRLDSTKHPMILIN